MVADRRLDGNPSALLEQGAGLPNDGADGGPTDVAEGIGQDVEGAQPPLVEEGKQDALAVADLLREDATAGTGLTWATAALVAEAFGSRRLPCGKSLGEVVQLGVGQSGQVRAGEPLDDGSARGAQVAVEKGEQIGGGGEADRGTPGS